MTSPHFIEALQDQSCFSHPVSEIKLKETHISWLVFTGRYVYKIKKPVQFAFVDFSTLEKRHWFCEEEVRLNRRLAPSLYLGVVPITGSPLNPQMDGEGMPFEYAVKMQQFPADRELLTLLPTGEIKGTVIRELARTIGEFHSRIDSAGESTPFGSPDTVWGRVEECFGDIPRDVLPFPVQQHLEEIQEWIKSVWEKIKPLVTQRKASGFIRECHGDLHLGNIALFDHRICVFDALEFNPGLRWIDVMSEIGFLVMDLESKKRLDLAYWFLNFYLEITGDYAGMAVFRLYELYRALVRAKVAGLRLGQVQQKDAEWSSFHEELINYVEVAHRLIKVSSPRLILMHGISGTGKTTVSTEVVKVLGAVLVRSDVERKRIAAQQSKEQAARQEIKKNLYGPDMTHATYERLLDHANTTLQAGYSVVVDAAFLHVAQRQPFVQLARKLQCPLVILDVWAPETELVQRLEGRARKGNDASDATLDIMKQQKIQQEPLSDAEQPHAIRINSTDMTSIQSAVAGLMRKE